MRKIHKVERWSLFGRDEKDLYSKKRNKLCDWMMEIAGGSAFSI